MSDLPIGWFESPLINLISNQGILTDGDWVESKDQDPSGNIKLIQLADIGDGKFLYKSNRYITDEKFISLDCEEITENDLLIARMPDPLGRSCIFPRLPNKCITVVDVAIVRPGTDLISTKWLMYFLNSPEIRQNIELLSSGTTRKRISRRNLEHVLLPIPPANEQKRIERKLDSLLARVDICLKHLDHIPDIIKRFRQAVLSAAVSGRLTKDWRDERSHNLESWESIRVGDKFRSYGGGTPSRTHPDYWNGDIGWLSSGDIKSPYIESSSETITKNGLLNSSAKMADKGSVIVVVRSGILQHTFPVAILSRPFAINQDIKCFDSGDPLMNRWLSMNWQGNEKDILRQNREGTTVQSVKFDTLINWELLIPPPEEQKEIIRQVEVLFTYADRLESRYQTTRKLVGKMTPALLIKAFRGELVTQDPNEEPASVLLERIRTTKKNSPIIIKKPRRRTRMETIKFNVRNPHLGIVRTLQEAGKELSSEQLFFLTGFPKDADAELIEAFFVEIRDALKNRIILQRRENNTDWFSLIK